MSIRLFPVVLHSVSASLMIWGYNQLSTLENHHFVSTQTGGHFQYLTIQGLAAACVTMILGLTADLFPSFKSFRKLQRTLLMISLPVSLVVSLIYWTLLLVNPSLVLPPAPNAEPSSSSGVPALMWIPLRLDLTLHASPAVTLLTDFIVNHESFTSEEANYHATFLAILAGVWYGTWAEYCASYNKIFPYPFLTGNPFNVRLGIYAGATMIALVSFRAINYLHPGRRTVK